MSFLHQNHQFEIIKKRIFLIEDNSLPNDASSAETGEMESKKALYGNLLRLAGLGETEDLDEAVTEDDKLKAAEILKSEGYILESIGFEIKQKGKKKINKLTQINDKWSDTAKFLISMKSLRFFDEEKRMELLEKILPGEPIQFDLEMDEVLEDQDVVKGVAPDNWNLPVQNGDIVSDGDDSEGREPHVRRERIKEEFPELSDTELQELEIKSAKTEPDIEEIVNPMLGLDEKLMAPVINDMEVGRNVDLIWYEGIEKDLINATRLRNTKKDNEEAFDEYRKIKLKALESLKERIPDIEAQINKSDNRIKILWAGKILSGEKAKHTPWGNEKKALEFLKDLLKIDKTGVDKTLQLEQPVVKVEDTIKIRIDPKAEIKVGVDERWKDEQHTLSPEFLNKNFNVPLEIPELEKGLPGLVWYKGIVNDLRTITEDNSKFDKELNEEPDEKERQKILDDILNMRKEAKKRLTDKGIKIPILSASPEDGEKNENRLKIRAATEYLYKIEKDVSKKSKELIKNRDEAVEFLNKMGISFGSKDSVESLVEKDDWEKAMDTDSSLTELRSKVSTDKWQEMMTILALKESVDRDRNILTLKWLMKVKDNPPTEGKGGQLWADHKKKLLSLGLVL